MTRALRIFATACAALVGAGAVARGQALDAQLLTIRDDATRDMVRSFVEAAQQRGTPVEPLIAKARQGAVFRADRKAIRQAMERLEKNLHRSRELLGVRTTEDEVEAGADALAKGVPENAIADLVKVARRRPITVDLGVLTELVVKGVPVKTAAAQVRELMARGATATQLTELNAAVQQDVEMGVPPIRALELRGRGVMSLLPPPISAAVAQPHP